MSTLFRRTALHSQRNTKAQAMVEFALALPIFLLIVYGLLETGRLIFIYASLINASRESVRYASASGINNTTSNTIHYQDCAGIRATAKTVGFLLNLQDNQIHIYWDRPGVSGVGSEYCWNMATDPSVTLQTGDRVLVNISWQYNVLVPIVPFSSRQIWSGLTARTYMGIINLVPTPTP